MILQYSQTPILTKTKVFKVFNDWTARAIQKVEMEILPGPHKGKDFANAIGPFIVAADEMEQYRIEMNESIFQDPIREPNVKGKKFDIK